MCIITQDTINITMNKYITSMEDEFLTFGNGHCDVAWDKVDNVCEMMFGGELEREPESLYKEYYYILKDLENVAVTMSGGIDSETIAEVCVKEKIPFRASLMRYMINGQVMNSHDLQYAEEFLDEHGIYAHYFDMEIESFLDSDEFWKICTLYYCISPQLACHLWLLSKLRHNTAVVPGDIMHMTNNTLSVNVFKYNTYDFFFRKNKQKGVAKILSHTPEIIASQILLQKDFKNTGTKGMYDKKCKLYAAGGFDAAPKPKKYTGFEEILKYYQMKYDGDHLYQVFNDRYRRPLEAKIQQPKQIYTWFNDELQAYIDEYNSI